MMAENSLRRTEFGKRGKDIFCKYLNVYTNTCHRMMQMSLHCLDLELD